MKKMKRLFYRLLAVALAFAMSGNLFFIPAFSVENETQYENEVVSEGTTNDNEEGESEEDGTENIDAEDIDSEDEDSEGADEEDGDSEETNPDDIDTEEEDSEKPDDEEIDSEELDTEELGTEELDTEEEDPEKKDEKTKEAKTEIFDSTEYKYGYIPSESDYNAPTVSYDGEIAQLHGVDIPEQWACDANGNLKLPSYITPLRNQNPYGTCWAFASIAAAEINMNKKAGKTDNDYSELHFAYFHYNPVVDPLGGTEGDTYYLDDSVDDFLDFGGNYDFSNISFTNWMGAADEKIAPFSNAGYARSFGLSKELAYNDVAHVKEIKKINIKTNPELVKKAIIDNGSVIISYCEGENRTFDSEYNSSYCGYPFASNHAVTIVGWNDAFPKEHFGEFSTLPGEVSDVSRVVPTPEHDGAWLVKNSWRNGGYETSHAGFFWLSYDDLSITTSVYSLEFESADDYDNNYQYDGVGTTSYFSYDEEMDAANVFKAHSGSVAEKLNAVSIFIDSAEVDYVAEIYKNPEDPSDPESGELIDEATVEGRFLTAGYYVIDLKTPVELREGDTFAVVFHLTSDEYISCLTEGGYYFGGRRGNYSIKKGQSFARQGKGATWQDLSNSYYNGNLRIKAFTDDVDHIQDEIELTDFELGDDVKGGIILNNDDTYSATIKSYTPENATSKRIRWSSSDLSVATVNTNGNVSAHKGGKAIITGTYTTSSGDIITHSFPVVVVELKINDTSTLYIGKERKLEYTIESGGENIPESMLGTPVWSSSNSEVISIDENGVIKSQSLGSAKIELTVGEFYTSAIISSSIDLKIPKTEVLDDLSVKISWDSIFCKGASNIHYELSKGGESIFSADDVGDREKYEVIDESTKDLENGSYVYYLFTLKYTNDNTKTTTQTTMFLDAHVQPPIYCTATFDANGGKLPEGEPSTRKIKNSTKYGELPIPTRKGYKFLYWTVFGVPINEESYMYYGGSITLIAQWEPIKCYVTFDPNGGNVSEDKRLVQYDKTYDSLPTPTRNGYTFDGWYTAVDGGVKVTTKSKVDSEEDYSLYAHWIGKKITVTLNPNGGQCAIKSIVAYFDSKYELLPTPTKTGFTFDGWYTAIDGGELIKNDSIVDKDTNIILYAHWAGAEYTITFDANGGQCGEFLRKVRYGAAYGGDETLPIATKENYNFNGWYTSALGGEKVLDSTVMKVEKDHILYAHFSPCQYKVSNLTEAICDDTGKPIENGGAIMPGTKLALSTSSYGAKIYYTTDASAIEAVSLNSDNIYLYDNVFLYEDAIIINKDMPGFVSYSEVDPLNPPADPDKDPAKYLGEITIYAIAIREGFLDSDVLTRTYKIINTDDVWGDVVLTPEERAKLAEELKEEGLIEDADLMTANDIPNGLWVVGVKDTDYCGSAITFPDMRVYYGKKLLDSTTDYSVKYSNNTKAGTATITISGKGNYTGKLTKNFEIQKLNLGKKQGVALEGCNLDIKDGVVIAYDNVVMQYNGKVQKATNTVTYVIGDKTLTLKAGTDFVYEYPGTDSKNQTMYPYDPDAFKAATKDTEPYCINIVAKDKGNFTGSTSFTETITDNKPVSKLSYTIKDNSYSNGEVGPDGKVYVMPSVFTVKDGKAELVPDVHFTYYITDNTQPGVATVHITGIPEKGFEGEFQKTFKITGTAISKAKVEGIEKSYVYTGKQIEEEILGTLNVFLAATKTALETTIEEYIVDDETGEGTGDYKVEITNNVKVGTATLTITGMNGYTGSVKKTFKITPYVIPSHVITSYTETKSITETDDFIIAVANEAVFAKGGAVPKISLVDKRIIDSETGEPYELKEGIDYTVKCTNNKVLSDGTGSKVPTVTITGKGNYSGKATATYAIKGSSLKNVTVTASDIVYKAGKSGLCKPSIVLTDSDGVKLAAGKDYDKNVIYTYAMDMPIDMDNPVEQMINKVSTPVERKEGDLVDSKDIIPAGCEIIATIKGIGCYAGNQSGAGTPSGVGGQPDDSTVNVRFRFIQSDISKATVKVVNKLYYNNGVPVELTKDDLSVVVNKQPLQKTDYEIVGYKNNKVKGTASVTIKGLGNYGGTKTVNYKIEGLGLKWLWDILDVG